MEDLKLELYDLSAKGYKEVVLVGIDLSSYGKDIGCHLVDAVTMACTTEGTERVRLGSLEPLMLTDKNLSILAGLPNFCPQFHLSLQSGCDATLKRMNRHYDTARYLSAVDYMRHRIPDISLSTDIIVAFPGETEQDFEDTLSMLRRVRYDSIYSFIYSPRKGTRAAAMDGQIPPEVSRERFARLLDEALEHGVYVRILDVSSFVHFDVLYLAMHLSQDRQAHLVLRLHGGLDLVFQLVVLHLALAFVMRLL